MEKKNAVNKAKVLDIVKQFDSNSKVEFQRSVMNYINFLVASSAFYRSQSRLKDFLDDCIKEVFDMIDFEDQGTVEKVDL